MGWESFFKTIAEKDYTKRLKAFLDQEYAAHVVYPPRHLVFNAFNLTPPESIKAVIIGQDPYHEPNQAMGLSFSVPSTTALPPSLVNIFKEIESDLGVKMKRNGDLTYLAKQGVLLLNAYLTVRRSEALSHRLPEYDLFMDDVLDYINGLKQPIVFLLWGGFSKKYAKKITNPLHHVLTCVHPSPLSANRGGWFGNRHFSKTNAYLISKGVAPVVWEN
ncbi:MAG: uracil-DNA glycosylase [Bacteroidia bacterium]|nr:uracil-DNA glycosylase [Bacteroidia bacterium]